MPTRAGARLRGARSQESHSYLTHGWQALKHQALHHLLPRKMEAELGLEPMGHLGSVFSFLPSTHPTQPFKCLSDTFLSSLIILFPFPSKTLGLHWAHLENTGISQLHNPESCLQKVSFPKEDNTITRAGEWGMAILGGVSTRLTYCNTHKVDPLPVTGWINVSLSETLPK